MENLDAKKSDKSQRIRIKLPGLISFIANITGLATGLAFTMIVTRSLSVREFGLWCMLSQYMSYVTLPLTSIVGFWVTRYTAREVSSAPKTGLLMALIFACISCSLYFSIALYATIYLFQPLYLLLLMLPQIFTIYGVSTLEAIARGEKPEYLGIGSITFEVMKVIVAYYLVRIVDMRLSGAILSVIIAQLVQTVLLFIALKDLILASNVNKKIMNNWIKHSWLPLYNSVGNIIAGIDVMIARIVTGSEKVIGIRSVSTLVGTFPRYSASLATSLYPRTLKKPSEQDLEEIIKLVSLFAIPIALGNILLIRPLLIFFGKEYQKAILASFASIITTVLYIINMIVDSVISGSELIDMKEDVTYKDYLNSKLFLLITLNHMASLTCVFTIYIFLSISIGSSAEYLSFVWNIAGIAVIPFVIYKYHRILKKIFNNVRIPWRNLLNYFISAVIMFLTLIPLTEYIEIAKPMRAIFMIQKFILILFVGAIIYLSITLIIDSYARNLSKLVLRRLKIYS